MPWTIRKRDDQWCVYKQDSDGEPEGDSLGCHESEAKAERQLAALHANVKETRGTWSDVIREYNVGQFRGNYPDVGIAEGVDIENIRARDPDPMFATLPIAEVGAISANGLLYDEALVSSLEEQINANRPGGIFGHLKDEERASAFPLPAGLWVGAKRFGTTLWAKSYIPPGAARDYVQTLKDVGGQIATSIYGKGKFEKVRDGVKRLANFSLESLDFAPPGRAALGIGAIPHVTSELTEQEHPMGKEELIAELRAAVVPPLKGWQPPAHEQETMTVAELTAANSAQEQVISELKTQVETMRRERILAAVDQRVSELTDWQVSDDEGKAKLKKLRDLLHGQIVMRLGNDLRLERVSEVAEAAWSDLQPIAETIRDALAGPPAIVNGRVQNSARPKLEDTPENRQRALGALGLSM